MRGIRRQDMNGPLENPSSIKDESLLMYDGLRYSVVAQYMSVISYGLRGALLSVRLSHA